MDNQRLHLLSKNTDIRYSENSPVLLTARALYLDTITGKGIAQFKWRNIDPGPVSGVQIELDCYDAFEKKLESTSFQYEGLQAEQNAVFGETTPVLLENSKTVRFVIYVARVEFCDGSVWENKEHSRFDPLPLPRAHVLEGKKLEQLQRDLAEQGSAGAASFYPQTARGLWQCGCGSWQYENTPCLKCRLTRADLNRAMDEELLEKHLAEYEEEQEYLRAEAEKKAEEERIAREKEEEEQQARLREEQERAEREEKRIKKRRKRILTAILAGVCVFALLRGYVLPMITYKNAEKLREEGQYDDSSRMFFSLGSFKDAADQVKETAYQKAEYLLTEGKTEEASRVFAEVGDYRDAAERRWKVFADDAAELLAAGEYDKAEKEYAALYERSGEAYQPAQEMVYECSYQKAGALEEEGKHDRALAIYAKIPTYKDSKEKQQAIHLIKGEDALADMDLAAAREELGLCGSLEEAKDLLARLDAYEAACAMSETGDYAEACSGFTELGEFLDAAEQAEACRAAEYDAAMEKLENHETAEAYALFRDLGSYKDSAGKAQAIEDDYVRAGRLAEAGEYDEAVSVYTSLYDYADSQEKINETWYQKAESLLEAGEKEEAEKTFSLIPDYADVQERLKTVHEEICTDRGKAALAAMDLETARKQFELCESSGEARDLLEKLDRYEAAEALYREGDFSGAAGEFEALGDFLDCPAQVEACSEAEYAAALEQLENGETAAAYERLTGLGTYSDSAEKAKAIEDEYERAGVLTEKGDYDEAIAVYTSLNDYSDSPEKIKEACYRKAESQIEEGEKEEAEKTFSLISGYKDTEERLLELRKELGNEAIAEKDYDKALGYYVGGTQTEAIKELEYELAETCFADGNYEFAAKAYELLGDYKQSASRLPEARYAWADQLFEEGDYAGAAQQFTLLEDLDDSRERARESLVRLGQQQMEDKQYETAKATFSSIEETEMVKECDYRFAQDMMAASDYAAAEVLFTELGNYSDSNEQRKLCIYEQAEELYKAKKYTKAEERYAETDGFKDSEEKITACIQAQADALFAAGDYGGAEKEYARIIDTDGSRERYNECRLQQGRACMDRKEFAQALAFLENLNYADSELLVSRCCAELGLKAQAEGDMDEAVRLFSRALSQEGILEKLYDTGLAYDADGQYEKASETFWICGEYEPAGTALTELAEKLLKDKKPEAAMIADLAAGGSDLSMSLFREVASDSLRQALEGYRLLEGDAFSSAVLAEYEIIAERNDPENAYMEARKEFIRGNYTEASELFQIAVYGGKEVSESLLNDSRLYSFLTEPGRMVAFGKYPQEADISAPVVWRYVGTDKENFLFVSEKILEYSAFADYTDTRLFKTDSDLFTPAEREVLSGFDIPSESWLKEYCPEEADRVCVPTAHALNVMSEVKTTSKGNFVWTSTQVKLNSDQYMAYNYENGRLGSAENMYGWGFLRPYISLKRDKALAALLTDGDYTFYDPDGKEVKYEP